MAIVISQKISEKLWLKHNVSPEEVSQCFANVTGRFLGDPREEHRSDPPTQWFIAPTNFGRLLKVVFVLRDGNVFIRSAFPPNDEELRIYDKYGEGS